MHHSTPMRLLLALCVLTCSGCALTTPRGAEPAPETQERPTRGEKEARDGESDTIDKEDAQEADEIGPKQANPPRGHKSANSKASQKSSHADSAAHNHSGDPDGSKPDLNRPTVDHERYAPRSKRDAQALAEVIAELRELGAIDQAAQQRVMEDLQKTDPSLWPQLVQYFRASLEFRDKQHGHEAKVMQDAGRTEVTPTAMAAATPAVETTPGKSEPISKTAAPGATAQSPPAAIITQVSAEAPVAAKPAAASPAATSAAAPVAKTGAVATAALDQNWQSHLADTIQSLESETSQSSGGADDVQRHALLRMMYLLDGRKREALRPIPGIAATQQDFWSKQIYALSTYLDAERNPDAGRRAAEAGLHLREATTRLGELATLHVKNMAFCTEVTSYGVYKKFDQYQFQSGQEVLLYAEVENFKSLPTDKGFHTTLKSSYQILDPNGARVGEHEFAVTQDFCQNPRHDFFIRYFVTLPKKIYGGTYTLQLTIEDTQSQKIGQSAIEFKIREK